MRDKSEAPSTYPMSVGALVFSIKGLGLLFSSPVGLVFTRECLRDFKGSENEFYEGKV